ncbi:MAG: ATP-binding protein [Verrucomicrobiota bacterium]
MKNEGRQDTIRLRVPGETRYLWLIRSVVTAMARDAGFEDAEVDKIEIAVDEACANVMDHAYRDVSPKPPLELEVRVAEGRFVVDVLDRGLSFDFNSYTPPQFPDHWMNGKTRGVGLYIIRKCMDDAQYERLSDKTNRLRLIKNLQPVA